ARKRSFGVLARTALAEAFHPRQADRSSQADGERHHRTRCHSRISIVRPVPDRTPAEALREYRARMTDGISSGSRQSAAVAWHYIARWCGALRAAANVKTASPQLRRPDP